MQAILTEYQTRQNSLQEKKTILQKEMQVNAKAMTADIIQNSNEHSLQIFNNQKKIDTLLTKLNAQRQALGEHIKHWTHEYDDLIETMKEVGDLSNWYGMIEEKLKK